MRLVGVCYFSGSSVADLNEKKPEQTVLAESINEIIESQNMMPFRYLSPLAEDLNGQTLDRQVPGQSKTGTEN